MSSRASETTNAAGLDNADSEWSHVAWAMLMPCGSRKGGIVKESLKQQRKRRFFIALRMTKQRFVIGEFISVTMNEPMLFCFVIDEFCSNRSNVA